jgi:probable O-glycosylation ligase (exosortase A-associated)
MWNRQTAAGTSKRSARVRDLFLIGFIFLIAVVGMRRPFMFVCGYIYIDIVSPQRISYYLLNSIPISLIFFLFSFVGWLMVDDKMQAKPSPRQIIMILLLLLCAYTTSVADFPVQALDKWEWVWKALIFAIFLPVTLYTRLRIETVLAFMLLSMSSIVVVGGIKTLAGGGGYGTLNLMVANNSGMYEGSTISAFAICIIPLVLFMAKYTTIIRPNIFVKAYCYAIAFACLLIPIGTQARTGLLCIALLAVLELRAAKRRFLYFGLMAAIVVVAIPLLPASYTARMDTIKGYKGESSAGTRLAVWKWTLGYVNEHPFGGGFNVYLQNKLVIDLSYTAQDGTIVKAVGYDAGRAFHNSYFEMLGEQGFPGLFMFLLIHLVGIFRMEAIRRAYRKTEEENEWVSALAAALQHAHLIYLLGGSFVGIAFQPFIYQIVALEIGFDRYVQRYVRRRVWKPFRERRRDLDEEPPVPISAPIEPPKPERGRLVPRFGKR